MKEVFLGGTCAQGTNWRDKLIPMLEIDYFNPVVDDWNDEAYQKELRKRKTCDVILYVITPLMEGVYSIAEVIDDSNKRPEKTVFCVLDGDGDGFIAWSPGQRKSLTAVEKMVKENGALVLDSIEDIAKLLNL